AALERIDHRMMLAMRVIQHLIHLVQIGLVEGQRLRPRKRYTAVALERVRQRGASSLLQDQRMEAHVHLQVARLVALHDAALAKDLVAVLEAHAQLPDEGPRGAPLRDPAPRKTLDQPAPADGPGD